MTLFLLKVAAGLEIAAWICTIATNNYETVRLITRSVDATLFLALISMIISYK